MAGGVKDIVTGSRARTEDELLPGGMVNFVVLPPRPEGMPDERPV